MLQVSIEMVTTGKAMTDLATIAMVTMCRATVAMVMIMRAGVRKTSKICQEDTMLMDLTRTVWIGEVNDKLFLHIR